MKIIELTEKNLPASAEIIRQSFKTVADEFNLTKESVPTNGAFLEDEKLFEEYRRGVKMFGLFEGETQIGFVALERNDGETFFLEKLAVLPAHRHKGGGKILMDYAKRYVSDSGGKAISIGIINENKRLLEWYKAYGFAEMGIKKFPHLPFTVCFMKLEI
jgi:ribosomal protein S18 acetylase RimI-like enzyme